MLTLLTDAREPNSEQCRVTLNSEYLTVVYFDGPAIYIITHKRAPLLNRRLVTNSILIDDAHENGTARPLKQNLRSDHV